MTTQLDVFRFDEAPMATDRSAGWQYVRAAGDVFEGAERCP
jgi:hypothetical protein